MDEIAGQIDFLSSSQNRVEVLWTLDREGPLSRRRVRDRVEASRSTVKRTLDALLELDWVAKLDGEYRTTPIGTTVLDAYCEFQRAVRTAETVAPVFRWLPEVDLDFDLRELENPTVVVPGEGEPYAPVVRQTELVRSIESFRGLLPSINLEGSRLARRRIVAGELTAEVVVSADVAATIREEPYAGLFREQLATGRMTVAVADELPFYLGLPGDGPVQLGVEDDHGLPRALLETRADAVRRWAEREYEDHREAATVLSRTAFE